MSDVRSGESGLNRPQGTDFSKGYDCQECGKFTEPAEIHTYEDCIRYLLRNNLPLNEAMRAHIYLRGVEAILSPERADA